MCISTEDERETVAGLARHATSQVQAHCWTSTTQGRPAHHGHPHRHSDIADHLLDLHGAPYLWEQVQNGATVALPGHQRSPRRTLLV